MSDSATPSNPYYNRPGLPALAYRLGDYHTFRDRLLSQLIRSFPSADYPQGVSLKQLTTRESNDPAIALLDAFAVLADVLTFYQERIANEGYLLTATERQSVLQLARMIGYEFNPGVAASALLAFMVDDAPGSPSVVTIPQGTQIQSLPEKEEMPQTFETSVEFTARVEWNALKPRPSRPQTLRPEQPQLYLKGISTQLQAGDTLLLMDGDGQEGNRTLLTLETVEPQPELGHTRITWAPVTFDNVPARLTLVAFRQRARLFGYNAPPWELMPDAVKQEAAVKHGKVVQGGVVRYLPLGDRPDPTLPKVSLPDGTGVQSLHAPDLPSTDVRAVAVSQSGSFFAGFATGVFRSKDQGKTWVGANAGLSNLNIQTLWGDRDGSLWVGTAEGGVFRTLDEGETWTPMHLGSVVVEGQGTSDVRTKNTAIPNTVVRSLLRYVMPTVFFQPTITSGTLVGNDRVSLSGTSYPRGLGTGAALAVGSQTAVVQQIEAFDFVTTLTVLPLFVAEFSVTMSPTSPGSPSFSLFAAAGSSQITIRGNQLVKEFVVGQRIRVAGVERLITGINSYAYSATVTVKLPLPADTVFLWAGTDDGLFRSTEQGKSWEPKGLSGYIVRSLAIAHPTSGRALFAGTHRGVFRSTNDGDTWEAVNAGLPEAAQNVYALVVADTKLLAGTQTGIYVLNPIPSDPRASVPAWVQHNRNPTLASALIRALRVAPAAGTPRDVFVATDRGVFRYADADTPPVVATPVINWGATALALSFPGDRLMLMGTRFVGFTETTTTNTGANTGANTGVINATPIEEDWFQFEIQPNELDLDATYAKLLDASWIVLANGEHQVSRWVQNRSTVQLQDFGLTSEVTRLHLTEAVDPAQFNRRTTMVLAQSEVLELAPDPLTVTAQQADIFFDPIWQNQIFLDRYIAGLQPHQQLVVNGKRLRARVNQVGGVFGVSPDTIDANDPLWARVANPGLTDTAVTALISFEQYLFAGTAAGGVFRMPPSPQATSPWEAVNEGLTDLAIQTFAVVGDRLVVGTAGGGVFRWMVETETWEAINQNLVHRDVQSLLSLPQGDLLAGTLSGGVVRWLPQSETWVQTALESVDVQTLAIAPNGHLWAGTLDQGVWRSTDKGVSWQPLNAGLTNLNITTLVAFWRLGSGTVTLNGTSIIGQNTRFTHEFTTGDQILLNREAGVPIPFQIVAVLSDTSLRVAPLLDQLGQPLALRFDQPVAFQRLQVLAGTAGSGILGLTPDPAQRNTQARWQPVLAQPSDLMIRSLFWHAPVGVYAATATGGLFLSIDEGDRWRAVNQGLGSVNRQLNPEGKVNTDLRAIAVHQERVTIGGIGILISPDNLYTVPIQSGDRLFLMAPPQPLLPRPPHGEGPLDQKWLLQDRDGFIGVVMTPHPQDVTLEPAAAADASLGERAVILQPPTDQHQPVLTLVEPLTHSYDPTTVSLYANVVAANHGEIMREVLGSGDGSATHQSFVLKKKPLTYVSAATPTGVETTLQVRVNNVLWTEVPSLYGRSPHEQVYITRIAADSTVTVTFGDGIHGMRLPTGLENVTAEYRSGLGTAGLVKAEQLILLKTRPQGITSVTNPLPATGAANPETLTEAKVSAPLTVRTLGRIVSLQDYGDFARAFAGIGKAHASVVQTDHTPLVHITVAAVNGGGVVAGTPLYDNLAQAIARAHDPTNLVQIDSYEPLLFNLDARLLLDPRHRPERVIATIQQVLLSRFDFERRQFGQAVTTAEVIATLQSVEGVIAVDLDALYRRDRARSLDPAVPVALARWDAEKRQILPAQLLTINPAGIRLRAEATL